MNRTTRIAAAVAIAAVSTALTGCSIAVDAGGAEPASSAGSGASSAVPASIDVPIPSVPSVTVGGSSGAASDPSAEPAGTVHLPPDFPLPGGAVVKQSTATEDEIAAKIAISGGLAAASFWRHRLPDAGYTVTEDDVPGGLGEMRFTGRGCVGDSQLAISDTFVLLQCDLT